MTAVVAEEPIEKWKKQRTVKLLVLSPSQLDTTDIGENGCDRRWWLKSVRKLPVPGIKPQVFGTVLHGVAERYISADDLGRDRATGKPVDLYPEGWQIARNRYTGEPEGRITPDEEDRVRRMFEEAVRTGIIERRPGRQIEREFHKTIVEPIDDENGVHLKITGFIDLCYGWESGELEVNDHKTSKDPKWFKSKNKLKNNVQMLVYAKVLLDEARENGANPSRVTLRHNQFCTDPANPVVRKTATEITAEEIDREWEKIQKKATHLQRLRERVDEWHQIPEPPTRERACNSYGGCAFRGICFGEESVQGYIDRMERHRSSQNSSSPAQPPPVIQYQQFNPSIQTSAPIQKDQTMTSFADRMATIPGLNKFRPPSLNPPVTPASIPAPQAAAAASPAPAPAVAAVAQTPPPAQVVVAAAKAAEAPPWADPLCRACASGGHPGYNSQGVPCKICDVNATKEVNPDGSPKPRRPPSHWFIIEPVGDGTFVVEPKPEFAEAVAGLMGGGQGQVTTPAPSAAAAVVAQDKSVPTPTEAVAAAAPAAAPATKRGRGRPRKETSTTPEGEQLITQVISDGQAAPAAAAKIGGFTLLVNCLAIGSNVKVRKAVYLTDVMDRVGKEMAAAFGVEHYADIGAFERRDYIAKSGEAIVQLCELGGANDLVICSGLGNGASDLRSVFDAIRPFAGMEIHPDGMR